MADKNEISNRNLQVFEQAPVPFFWPQAGLTAACFGWDSMATTAPMREPTKKHMSKKLDVRTRNRRSLLKLVRAFSNYFMKPT
jgi:hypothetical protein